MNLLNKTSNQYSYEKLKETFQSKSNVNLKFFIILNIFEYCNYYLYTFLLTGKKNLKGNLKKNTSRSKTFIQETGINDINKSTFTKFSIYKSNTFNKEIVILKQNYIFCLFKKRLIFKQHF